MKDDKLVVGEIVKPQGIKGQVKVISYSGDAEKFCDYKRVFVGGIERSITACSFTGDIVFLSLSGIGDRNAAELLRGMEISVLRSEVSELPEGEYYVIDLVGCDIIVGGEMIGVLTDVDNFGATDIYTIQRIDGKSIQVPAIEKVVLSIDIDAKKIILDKQGYEETVVD